MVETAICKLFCSEMGWRVVNDAMQIMGGEGYMTENEVERIFRDSRINLIVEGANEVMQSFIFAYGGKQLAEQMLGVQQAVGWDKDETFVQNLKRIARNITKPAVFNTAMPLAAELYLGIKPKAPALTSVDYSLRGPARRFSVLVRDLSHNFKRASKRYGETIVSRQAVQARLADAAMWLHAWACTLSKLQGDPQRQMNLPATSHFFDLAEHEIRRNFRELFENPDETMNPAADEALRQIAQLPNSDYAIPEASPVAKRTGRVNRQDGIKQFPGDSTPSGGTPGDGRNLTPSPDTPGEGRGEGSVSTTEPFLTSQQSPHPNPLPEYRERGQREQVPRATAR
jgi:hypothetical protein